jgi:hypothetical protein
VVGSSHISKHNDVAEHKNQTLVEMVRCLLQTKNTPFRFWAEAVYCANYFLNHISIQVVPSMTPVEQWCGKKLSVDHLRVFGCVVWAHISDDCRKKLDAKSHAFIMMGYSEESKAYRPFDPVKRQIIIKRNVWFDEKSSGIKLLHVSSVLLQDDPFNVVFDIGSHVPLFSPLTG